MHHGQRLLQRTLHVSCSPDAETLQGLTIIRYLTEFGGVDIWWTGSRLHELPEHLPAVGTPVNRTAIVPYRYHFNTVTFSYTTAFWSFEKWSLLLDWLALRGVNLPLAWNGNEYILVQVFKEAGLTDADIAQYLSGPAFQAWNRFGNLQGSFGGNLPMKWIDDQFALSKQIIQRMSELGMTPVLPSFTGFVPTAFSSLYPNASVVNGSQWSGFPTRYTNVSFLEPFDRLFETLQKSFISKQQEAYGADVSHIYTLDQYNENDPYSGDLEYLGNVTSNTMNSLLAADPDAVWLMQGWLFFSSEDFWTNDRVEAYLGGVTDPSRMIILDLYSEAQPQWNRTLSYFGKPWVWCELHDYGGNMGFEGNLEVLTTDPLAALQASSSMQGVGLTMEGQEGNEIVYNILLDQAWSASSIDVPMYVSSWVKRRYPVSSLPSSALKAWDILRSSVYSNTDSRSLATVKSIFELAPAITGLVNRTGHHPTLVYYDTDSTILPALQLLIEAGKQSDALRQVPEFRYDLVDVGRQLLANRFIDAYENLISIYNSTNSTTENVRTAGKELLTLLLDLDTLLFTDDNFLLSTWIKDAKSWSGQNNSYANYLEYNARNQITLWGPEGEINDYASKQWAGLLSTYYYPRWKVFVAYLAVSKTKGTAYNATVVSASSLKVADLWNSGIWGTTDSVYEAWSTKGDTWEVVQEVLTKWS